MQLTHYATKDRIEVQFRPLQKADIPAVISCIRDAYGDTYVKSYLYNEETLWAHHTTGALSFSVVETSDGCLAGIIANEVSPMFPGQCEIACQIILRRFTGYNLALPLARYTMVQAEQKDFQSQFARALGCHIISQKTLTDMGFTHCGFLLSVFDRTKLTLRYDTEGNPKIPQTVAVKRQNAQGGRSLFLPESCRPLAEKLYGELGLPQTFTPPRGEIPAESLWCWEHDPQHSTLLLRARQPGATFAAELAQALEAMRGRPLQTVNLLLNLCSPGSAHAYTAARELGFFFTGFFPCGEDGEYLILHHPLDVPVDMAHIPYLPVYEPYVNEIRRQSHE
ncbi:MAG: hypothetical protein RR226_00095 [Oscillospiraceae bacterium]